jgi:RNA recognition motif-containing protein
MLTSTFQPTPSTAIGPTLPAGPGQSAAASAAVGAQSTIAPRRDRGILRRAAGKVWADPSLDEWSQDDFRLFCGDLGNEVTDDLLANAFRKYKSFQKAKIIRDKRSGRTKGFGFASFVNPEDMIAALREVNGKYVGNRPIRLKKSSWKDRNIDSEKNARVPQLQYAIEQDSTCIKKFKKINRKKQQKEEKVKKKL